MSISNAKNVMKKLSSKPRLSALLVLPGGHRTRKHTDSAARLAAAALAPKLTRPTPTA